MSACILITDTGTLCLGLSFQKHLYGKQPWMIATVSPSGIKTRLTIQCLLLVQRLGQFPPIVKDAGSLSSGFFPNATHWMDNCHLPFICPCRRWESGTCTNGDSLPNAITMTTKKSFFSNHS